jgi:hypothetical protein
MFRNVLNHFAHSNFTAAEPIRVGLPRWFIACVLLIIALPSRSPAAEASETVSNLPSAVDLRPAFKQWGLPLRSQGSRGTCSVFAMTGGIEFALASQRQAGTVLSVEFLNWASHQAMTNTGDGGFFADLWNGFERYGICAETNWPYQPKLDSHLQPDKSVLRRAKQAARAHLRLEWIKPWDVTTGLTDEQFQAIKRTLARGWPVCGGLRWPKHETWKQDVLQMVPPAEVFDGHSVLLVGFRDDPAQPGGGVLLIRNSGGGVADGAMPYAYARAYLNDAAWIAPRSQR